MKGLNWDQVPKRNKIIYAVLLAGSALYLYWLYFLDPAWVAIEANQAIIETKRVELNKAEALANQEAQIRQELENLKSNLEAAKQVLPSEKEVDVLLEQLSKLAQTCGIKFDYFQPQLETNKSEYLEVPVQISGVGTYASLGNFLSEITKLSRLVKVLDIKLNRRETKSTTIAFSMSLSTYRVTK